MTDLISMARLSRAAAEKLNLTSDKIISSALKKAAAALISNAEFLKTANAKDVSAARKNNKSEGFIDRLVLSDKVIQSMADGLIEVADAECPAGRVLYTFVNRDEKIKITEKAVPFGVIGIIYEARPNVSADAFALCFKSKNAVILKGGSDAINSNIAVVSVLKSALKDCGIDENAVALIEDTSRETASAFMKLNGHIDLLIPRGGASLIRAALSEATVPIIETGLGNCHIFVDKTADIKKAVNIIFNAKTQRYGVCNACESLIFHSDCIENILPEVYAKLREKEVEIRADEKAFAVLKGKNSVVKANEEDFYAEYGAPVISVKTVDCLDEAVAHINKYGTHHSDSIITENSENARIFTEKVDSAAVYVNASTRFTDGSVFGFGAEIGISTQKLHARGPMGLTALTTTKYFVEDISGNGAVRK